MYAAVRITPAHSASRNLTVVEKKAGAIVNKHKAAGSNKIVAIASVDGKEQAEYTDFSVDFKFKDGKNFDPAKKYKLAVVCSSSKDGDKFSGAPGSVLYVDDLEVTF